MPALPTQNPFSSTIVADPRQIPAVDVSGIHQAAFDKCLAKIAHVRESGQSAALVLYGVAGAGKTHLLGRLRRHLAAKALANRSELSICVPVRMNTSPRRLWQHVRESFVEELTRKFAGDAAFPGDHTYLAWITARKLSELSPHQSSPELWYSYLIQPQKDREGIVEFLDETVRDLNVSTVLRHLYLGEHRKEARAWIRGDSLSDAALEMMGLGRDDADLMEAPEDRARKVVQTICRLGASIPFVFCFDQIEALQTEASPESGFKLFGRMASDLHDCAENAVIVSCIQMGVLPEFQGTIGAADRDRIMPDAEKLDDLSEKQCFELASTLLDSAPELAGMKERQKARAAKKLWPLDDMVLRVKLNEGLKTPRRLKFICSELYECARTGAAKKIVETPDDTVSTAWSAAFNAALTAHRPEQTEGILLDALPLAMALLGPQWRTAETTAFSIPTAVVFEKGNGRRLGVCVCNHENMNSLAAHLKRLRAHLDLNILTFERFFLMRHSALQISPGAKKVAEHLEALDKIGAPLVNPKTEWLVALAALRDILAEAKSGDLARAGETVPVGSVRAWLTAHPPLELTELFDLLLANVNATDSGNRALNYFAS